MVIISIFLTISVVALSFTLIALGLFVSPYLLLILIFPLIIMIGRGVTYARPRTHGIKMSPTQFPEGYQMVVDAAARFGLEYVPDAYVLLGNGQINAFASGHGFRRFVVIYSDLFEVGGAARSPEALRFIIGHEVGHIAASHTSYWRLCATIFSSVIPGLAPTLSRAQEYTADNYGYYNQPEGSAAAIGVLGAGKYLVNQVSFDELADRATSEKGVFVWLTNFISSHPVLTWRAAALRDRSHAGRLLFRPQNVARGIGAGNVQYFLAAPPAQKNQLFPPTSPN